MWRDHVIDFALVGGVAILAFLAFGILSLTHPGNRWLTRLACVAFAVLVICGGAIGLIALLVPTD